MASIRALSKHSRSLSRTLNPSIVAPVPTRSFHSPFAVLKPSLLERAPSPSADVSPVIFYEKAVEHIPEPLLQSTGSQMYVVSEPDPSNTPYEVPSGAFPTSAPYQNYTATEAPPSGPRSSTSASFAHPFTTAAAPQNESGVNESSAVRFREAQGELHQRGGSDGGLGLMDAATTHKGKGELASRNPGPDRPEVAKKNSDLGVNHAWKQRK